MNCQYCKSACVKIGRQKTGTQKYRCKECEKYQQEIYIYQAKVVEKRKLISKLITGNCGFRGIAKVLEMSVNTVTKTVIADAAKCQPPPMPKNGVYEVDEMQAYHKKGEKDIWAVYAIERETGKKIGI
ncbi:MAG: hypothetical protein ACOZCO_01445, partial [Bacteroidota bacterium]